MFIADGGGSAPIPPDYVGEQKLHVDPSAIPAAKAAFQHALDQLEAQLKVAGHELTAREWANDPVSKETAERFNRDTFENADSALQALDGYKKQLEGVIDQLTRIEEQYRMTEGDNAALWGKH